MKCWKIVYGCILCERKNLVNHVNHVRSQNFRPKSLQAENKPNKNYEWWIVFSCRKIIDYYIVEYVLITTAFLRQETPLKHTCLAKMQACLVLRHTCFVLQTRLFRSPNTRVSSPKHSSDFRKQACFKGVLWRINVYYWYCVC